MGMLGKSNEENYAPLADDESSQSFEHNDLLHGNALVRWRKRAVSWKSRIVAATRIFLLVAIYSTALIILTSMYWKKERLHGAGVIDTPLRPYMHFEPTDLMIGEESKDYKLVGQASDELDAAWSELMADFFTDVPYSYVESVGRLEEGIPTKSGGFLGTYSFMHQLHCVKRIHHSYWPERYYPNTTEQEKINLQEHNLHCLQMLLKLVMCKADPIPETLRWVEQSKFPLGNRTSPHECVNWQALMTEMKRHRVDPFEPGVLVHPHFGAVVPEGKDTIIDEKDKHRFVINGTSVLKSDLKRIHE